MKRKIFLYAGLLLMGIMGALSLGVVRASDLVKVVEGLTLTGEQDGITYEYGVLEFDDGNGNVVRLLDRNLGAYTTGVGADAPVESYGYYYQRGNNYGFQTTGNIEKTSVDRVDVTGYGPGNYYKSDTFIKAWGMWTINKSDVDLWGKWRLNGHSIEGLFQESVIDSQGPCPEGYHVPVLGEWEYLATLWYNVTKDENVSIGSFGKRIESNLGIDFANDFFIPFAGNRDYGTTLTRLKTTAWLQTASADSPYGTNVLMFWVEKDSIITNNSYLRTEAMPLRCFSNDYLPHRPLVISFMDDVEVSSGTVESGSLRTGDIPALTKDGYEFEYRYLTGDEDTPFDFENTLITEDTTLYAKWIKVVTVKFDVNGGNETIAPIKGKYNESIDKSAVTDPARGGYRFLHRYLSGDNENNAFDFSTPITGDITLIANWKKKSSNNGGGGSSSSETNTGSTTNTGSNNINTGSTNTGTVNTGANLTGDTQDSSNKSSEGQSGYSQEFIDAYNFAFQNGITTMPTIDQADMTGNLTRIQMAKMLSYYAINIMGKKPDETRNNKFNDVSKKLDADYNNGVTLAYQLGIMGINMPNNNFRPNDLVTRGEFVTALSRMIYGTEDGEYGGTSKYYTKHIEKLNEEEIIKQIDPSMKELRAYVMIMLKRASEK